MREAALQELCRRDRLDFRVKSVRRAPATMAKNGDSPATGKLIPSLHFARRSEVGIFVGSV
jgi:hypothetical protein